MFSELLERVTTDISTEKPAQAKFWDRVQPTDARFCIDLGIFRTNLAGSWCLSYLYATWIRLPHAGDVGRLLRHGGEPV